MIALIVTAFTPHGAVSPVGVALDGLLASVVWHRRKAQIAATGGRLAYRHDVDPEPLELPLARCGDDADWHWMATVFADLHLDPTAS